MIFIMLVTNFILRNDGFKKSITYRLRSFVSNFLLLFHTEYQETIIKKNFPFIHNKENNSIIFVYKNTVLTLVHKMDRNRIRIYNYT